MSVMKMRDARIVNTVISAKPHIVIPAKARIQCLLYERHWAPAFAGTTTFCFRGDVRFIESFTQFGDTRQC
jgi:hypothetical protein